MPEIDAGRNLLFGILALQSGFISKDHLVAATSVWMMDKSSPLAQILRDKGAIGNDEYQLLSALVEKHLEKHGGDPQKSLAAVSSLGSAREELRKLGDADVEETLGHIPAARDDADRYATNLPSVGQSTSQGLRFQILRPHAKGGLGQVSVARDEELHREVALKEIQPQHADHPESQARFIQEAEITGQLEHPGIVPVYGLGQYADGRPFYAMRFIKGDSLQDAIERFHNAYRDRSHASERGLELRKLLGRFIDVCQAIEYAHSRGVLHRDLKPGNIMVGKYGETLVVDWGLAKPVDSTESYNESDPEEPAMQSSSGSGSAPTQMGSAIGTPEYMSPEQAAGRLDLVGGQSDVYSLGATLYYLLTGGPPVQGADVETKLKKVRKGDFPRVRQADSSVPKALDAICMKAMSRDIIDRYLTPAALAEDIEHWLADEPVRAYRESTTERLMRWARKHRAWAQAGAANLLLVTLVSLVALTLTYRSRNQAIEARKEADLRFDQAREAVDQFFTFVSEDVLLDQPGMQPLQSKLLGQARDYYTEFLKNHGDDPALREEAARTNFRVGVVEETLGHPDEAIFQYNYGLKKLDLLATSSAPTPPQQLLRSDLLTAKGRALLGLERKDKALTAFRSARNLRQELVKQEPTNTTYLRKLASVSMNVAVVEDDRVAMKKAQELRQQILSKNPEMDSVRRDLAMGYFNLGRSLQLAGDREEARQAFEQAAAAFSKYVERNPDDLTNKNRLATAFRLVADMTNEAAEKDLYYEKAFGIAEPLASANRNVLAFQHALAALYMSFADHKVQSIGLAADDDVKQKLYRIAMTSYKSAVDQLDVHKQSPGVSKDYQVDLAASRLQLARLQMINDDEAIRKEGRSVLQVAKREIIALLDWYPNDKRLLDLSKTANELRAQRNR